MIGGSTVPGAPNSRSVASHRIKGTWQWGGFSVFLQKLVPHESFTLPFEPFRFWLRICGDIHIRKTTPRYHRYWESPTPHIVESESRLLRVSPKRKVDDSANHWVGEWTTPRISDTGSRYSKEKLDLVSISRTRTMPLKVQFGKNKPGM